MLVPIQTAPQQPIKRKLLPSIDDSDLRGSWLNWQTALDNLGTDYSAAGDDMTPIGSPTTAPLAGCKFVAASSQYLRRVEADWRAGDSLGTISAWIKRDLIGVAHVIFCSSDEVSNARYLYFFVAASNLLNVTWRANGGTLSSTGSTTIVADRWYHVAVVSNGSHHFLYVNGIGETVTGVDDGTWLNAVGSRDNITIGVLRRTTAVLPFDGTILDCRYYSRVLSADEIKLMYQQGVPDDSLLLHCFSGDMDLSKYERTLTPAGDVVFGHDMDFDGTDDKIDCGDLGNIQTIMGWVNPGSTTEELWLVDTDKDIMVNAGTVTYTGLTPVATYVDGVATTTMVANRWQHLACVIETVDANNFELGWDGTNYGDSKQRDVKVFSEAKAANFIKRYYMDTCKFF